MKTIGIIAILLFSPIVLADDDCLISGVFNIDTAKTMADFLEHHTITSPEEKRAWTEVFSSLSHEWRCDEMRGGNFGYEIPWQKVSVTQLEPHTLLVSFPEKRWPDLTLVFEGPCYKSYNSQMNFHDYFCPVEE
ncbi:MAG: hypothetical protein OQJ84_02145 [Xanthomonadales bacterium]|nr:hypothetical protein [Xanthomonadales bacterium]